MCGIVGYIGNKNASKIILKALKRLEYRGYDSAGIAVLNNCLDIHKSKGKVSDLENLIKNQEINGSVGIGHTRWATHGAPNNVNAHPHANANGDIAIIHNGIIENYNILKEELVRKGYIFKSETDSEVVVHFIEDLKVNMNCTIFEAFRIALTKIVGAYAIVLIANELPDEIIVARRGSPIVIGIGKEEFYVASDPAAFIEYTKEVIYLKDEEIATISKCNGVTIKTLENVLTSPFSEHLDLELISIEKGGYDHFMLKEIFEQPASLKDCIRGRLIAQSGMIKFGGLEKSMELLKNANRITILGCGTSWHAGLVGEYLFEELIRTPVDVEYASEFRYRNPVINPGDIIIAISQSGETADTLSAIQLAKSKGATVIGICNVVGSSIARECFEGAYLHIGPEIGVASTKAFTAQVMVLTLIALEVANLKGTIDKIKFRELLWELDQLPEKIDRVLQSNQMIKNIAETFKNAKNFLYLGRGTNFPVALEGALKLKEISYIHAEGYPAAEMKHGPIALIDGDMPVLFIANKDNSYAKIISNIQEVKARKGRIIAIVTEGEEEIKKMAEFVIEIPITYDIFLPIINVIPLQLLAYHMAVFRDCNVDQPRNLAKSVTVE